ncbi:MAG: DUF4190 domain-containing protein [Clostridia bacterium]|nr:DUF4190 domain-containing protein [Clostridia bacterium]
MDQNNNNVQPSDSTGLAIASMVLGIISLIFFCASYISFCAGIIGIILGAISLACKKDGKGMAIAGLVCSSVSVATSLLLFLIGVTLFSGFSV